MLSEMTKTKVAVAREDFSSGFLSKEALETVLVQNKFLLLYLAYQRSFCVGKCKTVG